jgi:hypothetical protein
MVVSILIEMGDVWLFLFDLPQMNWNYSPSLIIRRCLDIIRSVTMAGQSEATHRQ